MILYLLLMLIYLALYLSLSLPNDVDLSGYIPFIVTSVSIGGKVQLIMLQLSKRNAYSWPGVKSPGSKYAKLPTPGSETFPTISQMEPLYNDNIKN